MTKLSARHCEETLACLMDIFVWENTKDRAGVENALLSKYLLRGCTHEICVSAELRAKLLVTGNGKSIEAEMMELKAFVLSELRFNPVVVESVKEVLCSTD
jgi:hypothetical protein